MIDFNAHILFGFSDGPETASESSALLKKLAELGFKKVVCAPRYLPRQNQYVSKEEKKKKIRELELVAKYNGTPMKLFFASEVFLNKDIDEFVQKGEISLLSKRYVLIKLPERGKISLKKVEEVLVALRRKNYVPILANPEKSEFLQEDFSSINKLSGTGAMFQCSFSSIVGLNGRKAEKLMEYMLEKSFVDFLGTDVRSTDDRIFLRFEKAKKKIERIVGEQGFQKIMRNAEGVL